MIRTLLTTTALVSMLATGAIAQDAPATPEAPATEAPATEEPAIEAPATEEPAMEAPAAEEPAMDAPAAEAPAVEAPAAGDAGLLATGYTVADSDDLASAVMGKPVYSSSADDAEHIGDVNDLVIAEDGSIAAAIIGVGGFLGIGEKLVAVNYDALEFTIAADNTERYVLATTKEALEAAPAFEITEDAPAAEPALEPAAPGADAPAMDAPAMDAPAVETPVQ